MVWPLTLPAVVLAWLRKFVSALLAWFATVIDSDTASRWCPQLRTVVQATKVVTHVPKFGCLAGHFAATLHIPALRGQRVIVATRLRANSTASHCALGGQGHLCSLQCPGRCSVDWHPEAIRHVRSVHAPAHLQSKELPSTTASTPSRTSPLASVCEYPQQAVLPDFPRRRSRRDSRTASRGHAANLQCRR